MCKDCTQMKVIPASRVYGDAYIASALAVLQDFWHLNLLSNLLPPSTTVTSETEGCLKMWSGCCTSFPMVTNPRRDELKTDRKQMNKIRKGQLKVLAKIPRLCSRTCRLEAILRKLLIEEEPNLEQFLFRM